MQNKGAIKLFAIALALVSLYQLSFTFFTTRVENKAEEYAKNRAPGDVELELKYERNYLDSMSSKVVYNFFWLRKYTYSECLEREINLGLDLRGGMNVILQISMVDVVRSLSNYSTDTTFVKAIELAQERRKGSQEDFITLFGEAFEEIAPDAKLASPNIFGTYELKDKINPNTPNEEVLKVIREETQNAMDNSFKIIRSRIDKFGVAQPNIQRLQESSGRILVELPGVKDHERVRKLLQGTAHLEFYKTYENREIFPMLQEANKQLKQIRASETEPEETDTAGFEELQDISETQPETSTSETEDISLLEDDEEPDTTDEESLLENLEEDTAQTKTPSADSWRTENPLFAILNPRVTNDGNLIDGSVVGISDARDTAEVNEILDKEQIRSLFPQDVKFLWSFKPINTEGETEIFELHAIQTSQDGKAALDGEVIENAEVQFGDNRAAAEVSMAMNSEGASEWARITKEAASKTPKRCVAIVLDNYVYSSPRVQGEIPSGRSQITGNFTIAEAKDLANVLESGKLPAPARIIEDNVVGPSLGEQAINSGLLSFIIAFVVVMLYMIFYYKNAGIIANIALITNLFFIFGVLASLQAVLTLPGIAGIVLTIGMSVDANVLIYERIREEMAEGKGLKLAISDGYKNAYSAIIDANVTTLLTAIILFNFGHGPIKGFATTLIIGILTSLFTAIFITRLIFENFLSKNKEISFATKISQNAFKNLNIDFLSKRKTAYIISGIIIIIGIGSLFTRGLNQGVDFVGGRNYVVEFKQDVSTTEIANSLEEEYLTPPEVKTFGGDNQVKITTKYLIETNNDKEIASITPQDINSIEGYTDFVLKNKYTDMTEEQLSEAYSEYVKGKENPNFNDFTAYLVQKNQFDIDQVVERKLYNGLQAELTEDVDFETFMKNYRRSSQKVGPTIADDIKSGAFYATIFALIAMFIYIFIRFRNWQFGLGALAALVHDVLIVLGLFSLLYGILPFSLEIDQAFIAAILTVVGYSLNDTVVVFDRIREYLTKAKRYERKQLYNNALNSTISRTFSTSLSTFFVLLAIFIFGGEVIRGFIFALLVGVIVGTYSSLFIATPVVFDTNRAQTTEDTKPSKKRKKRK